MFIVLNRPSRLVYKLLITAILFISLKSAATAKPTDNSTTKPTDKTAVKPANKPTDRPADELEVRFKTKPAVHPAVTRDFKESDSQSTADLALDFLTLEIVVVTEPVTQWSESEISSMIHKTNTILAQCSIYLIVDKILHTAPQGLFLGYESVGVSNQFYDQENRPILLLITNVDYNQSVGFTPGSRWVMLSSYSRTATYKDQRDLKYEPLAHELGHMLGNLNHLTPLEGFNLMAGYISHQSDYIHPDQCKKMRTHKDLVKKQPELPHSF